MKESKTIAVIAYSQYDFEMHVNAIFKKLRINKKMTLMGSSIKIEHPIGCEVVYVCVSDGEVPFYHTFDEYISTEKAFKKKEYSEILKAVLQRMKSQEPKNKMSVQEIEQAITDEIELGKNQKLHTLWSSYILMKNKDLRRFAEKSKCPLEGNHEIPLCNSCANIGALRKNLYGNERIVYYEEFCAKGHWTGRPEQNYNKCKGYNPNLDFLPKDIIC